MDGAHLSNNNLTFKIIYYKVINIIYISNIIFNLKL